MMAQLTKKAFQLRRFLTRSYLVNINLVISVLLRTFKLLLDYHLELQQLSALSLTPL